MDLTRKKDFSQKKTRSVSAARVTHDMVSSTAVQKLFNIPANCVIVDAMVVVEVPGQNGLTVDFGYTGADNALGNDLDIDGPAGVVTVPLVVASTAATKAPRIATGTGKEIIATFSADPTAGSFVFVVEYVELDLTNGQLTNLSDGT